MAGKCKLMTTATQFDRQETEVIANRAPKSGSKLLLESIAEQGVDLIFGYPGGAIMPVYDELPNYPQLRHILCRHEQGCGMAAIGYARATGKVGTAFATSCLLYTSPSPRDQRGSRMPSSA